MPRGRFSGTAPGLVRRFCADGDRARPLARRLARSGSSLGPARYDFPGGSAAEEQASIQSIHALSGTTRVFTGHDCRPGGRELQFCGTVGEHAANNRHLRKDTSELGFVKLRADLEKGEELPNLSFQALQVNIRGGQLPEPEDKGVS